MLNNSWLHLKNQDPAFLLQSLGSDELRGVDCGWVEQMRPFIRQYSTEGDTVLDPFCGYATTLLAAGLEGRKGVGVEIERHRNDLANHRLNAHGIKGQKLMTGSLPNLIGSIDPVDLVLTSVPYFGCRFDSEQSDQLYGVASYQAFLQQMRESIRAMKQVLKPNGYAILMAENLRVGKHFVPMAWDIAKLLDERLNFVEERVLVYTKSVREAPHSNRAHEYALIAQNVPNEIDIDASWQLVKALQTIVPELLVYGSFAQRQLNGSAAPSDVDVFLPFEQEAIQKVVNYLGENGFEMSNWGKPIDAGGLAGLVKTTNYLRGEQLYADGKKIRIDVSFSSKSDCYQRLKQQAQRVDGVLCCGEPFDIY